MNQTYLESPIKGVDANNGEKTFGVKITFFTNAIAEEAGKILPKHAWCNGTINVIKNNTHGIVPSEAEHFHSPWDLLKAIWKLLKRHEITLLTGKDYQKVVY